MSAELLTTSTPLSPEECRRRITVAASQGVSQIVGYALSSQADLIDNGDGFEVQSKGGPAVLIGTVASDISGSIVHGRIEVPLQRFYRFASVFVILIAAWIIGTSAYDLAFGTHRLLTRSSTDLPTEGHPASIEQHLAVFLFVPVVAVPILVILWPTTRPVDAETLQMFREFLERMFEAKQSVPENEMSEAESARSSEI